MFVTYGEKYLLPINTNASSSEILVWKNKREVANSYKMLFKKIGNYDDSPLLITHIIKKVFMEKNGCSKAQV